MTKSILVINSGSSSVKYSLYEANTLNLLRKNTVANQTEFYAWLQNIDPELDIQAVGHRVVHGGMEYVKPTRVTPAVMQNLKMLIPLAPLHLPHNLQPIEMLAEQRPDLLQVACFDTAFHATQPLLARIFALPYKFYTEGVRHYGFHGLSYEYIAGVFAQQLNIDPASKIIVAHLGNGASMCAIQNGHSSATTMGFSALEGLMMGTRCGRIDPGVLLYLAQEKNYSSRQIEDLLYNKSGLQGVSGISNDMRELLASSEESAKLAVDLFCYKAAMELSGLIAPLHGCEAIIFTAGIGENSAPVRAGICKWLEWLGVEIDAAANQANNLVISTKHSKVLVAVIPTNEEIIIARATTAFLSKLASSRDQGPGQAPAEPAPLPLS